MTKEVGFEVIADKAVVSRCKGSKVVLSAPPDYSSNRGAQPHTRPDKLTPGKID